ncbi:hypothetical protein ACHAWU_010034 [Discostella pseudostelligera]|uniref:Thioredoxin domain-containing protein n=1 Tax=Discostella pseudostelligera TaxID=259834 RepID=A0ABD3N6J1_9STRA
MLRQITFFLALAASSLAIELTPENYAAETDGKTVFLKFFAPWCGHCKALKPDWDKLMADFEGSATQLVADVDCTTEGQPLCDENGVQGFPTLKWGDASDLQDYQGGRSYEELKKFADENLKPICSLKSIDLCDDEKKAQIKKYQDMTVEELKSEVTVQEGLIEAAEKNFQDEVQKLQAAYEQLNVDKNDAIAKVKASGLGLMKSVIRSKESPEAKDEL